MFLPLFFLVCLTLLGPCNCSTFPANLDLGFLAHFWNDSSVGYRIKGIGLERVILNGFSLGRGHEELCFWRGTSLGQCIKSPVSIWTQFLVGVGTDHNVEHWCPCRKKWRSIGKWNPERGSRAPPSIVCGGVTMAKKTNRMLGYWKHKNNPYQSRRIRLLSFRRRPSALVRTFLSFGVWLQRRQGKGAETNPAWY